ncbi:MAG TPA: carbamoyltransferase HypF [Gemmatimonadaceae bacterium]|nr:carbamoyltransferase HypF [Gemmatimonadaceae bacterium]
MTAAATRRRCRVQVAGIVQGVGFRPFVHRLATRHRLDGWVRNTSGRVDIELDGAGADVAAFLAELRAEAPPLSRIDKVSAVDVDVAETDAVDEGFRILESLSNEGGRRPVPADVAMCAACERELFDPSDRRFEYPFITCTDCGPRYTVIESLPYDRERTTMRWFTQCPECEREYRTPGDRRHHSETNSCPVCGPRLWIALPSERVDSPPDNTDRYGGPLRLAAALLRGAGILAVRGVGGFHLAVDATNDDAVRRLRERKRRDAKPLAVMVRTLDEVRAIARVSDVEAELLMQRERPIVLLESLSSTRIAPSVAPGLRTIGVMLAYSPLHHLLLSLADRPLVMTSGNRSEEPIAASIPDGVARLSEIADLFLMHDREIESPVDDSVIRVSGNSPAFIRRARGYAPKSIPLPCTALEPILAVGGHLKSTFTLAAGDDAYVSPHLGDLDTLETLQHFRATLDRYSRLFRIVPRVVARDLHSGYLSTRIAAELDAERCIVVQHHHAHIAAVLGEHGHDGRVIGVSYDGTGAGDDGTSWGAELFVADQKSYERVGHLRAAPLPGGDLAVRTPWRSALGYSSLEPSMAAAFANALESVSDDERHAAERQVQRNFNAPLASSMGRLFDAAAAILGVCRVARFEGDAAMRLEALAGSRAAEPLPFPVINVSGRLLLDPVPLFAALAEARQRGERIEDLAAAFHESVAAATAAAVVTLCQSRGLDVVALGGGVFQNARLTTSLRARLEAVHLKVLTSISLPANDGGLSYGQAVVAAAVLHDHQ